MPSTKVSIILTNYNYGQFVGAAVESALGQTYTNVEVIVVDDGSTDESRERLEQYTSLAKVIFQAKGNQTAAINTGFALSTGQFVAFLDSDDALFPDAVEQAVAAWHEGTSKVQFPLEILSPEGSATGLLMPRAKLSRGNVLNDFLKTGRYVASPNSGNLFPRSFLEKIFPVPADEWDHVDAYCNTYAPFLGEITALDRPLGYYRIHGKSLSSVTHAGTVDVRQMERLMRNAMAEKAFLERLACERGLAVSRGAVVAHWMNLKLSLSLCKVSKPPGLLKIRSLAKLAMALSLSAAFSSELGWVRKLQDIVWAVCVAILPARPANRLIQCAFELSPQSGFMRLMRRL